MLLWSTGLAFCKAEARTIFHLRYNFLDVEMWNRLL
jgi:hypothetical protein